MQALRYLVGAMVYTTRLWAAAFNIGLSSLLFGYSIACLNTVLAPGDNASPEDCANGLDPTCPKGSILNDMLLSTGERPRRPYPLVPRA